MNGRLQAAAADSPTLHPPLKARLLALCALALAPLLLWAGLPLVSTGATPRSLNEIQDKIQDKQRQVDRKKGAERVLTSDIAGYTARIDTLQSKITTLQRRQVAIQTDLDAKRAELVKVQTALREERARLTRLKARLIETRTALADRLVELYKADDPDLITLILDSEDLSDLMERGEFLRRISEADRNIVAAVKTAKADAKATSERLAVLERRKQEVAAAIMRRRDEVVEVKDELEGTRQGYARTRDRKRTVLRSVREERMHIEGDLDELRAAQAKIEARLAGIAAGNTAGLPAGPIRQGSGSMIWPVNGAFTSPFGTRWGRLHAGIDIGAPEGTPIRAADSGTVVVMQGTASSGGYGNYTCLQHGASLSTCYAHQVSFGTSMGASVSKGQVIGYVGNTGNSFGAHLHFEVRVGGSPVDPMGYL